MGKETGLIVQTNQETAVADKPPVTRHSAIVTRVATHSRFTCYYLIPVFHAAYPNSFYTNQNNEPSGPNLMVLCKLNPSHTTLNFLALIAPTLLASRRALPSIPEGIKRLV